MKIYKIRTFCRWQKTEKVQDKALYEAVKEMEEGLVDAELGGNIVKKRVARPGFGKRSGYRVLIATRRKDKCFFIYGFAKNEQENINSQQLSVLKETARELLNLSHTVIENMLEQQSLQGIKSW